MSDAEFEFKKRFAELRASDEGNAPSFEAMLDHAHATEPSRNVPRRRRWVPPILLTAAVAVLAAVWVTTRASSPNEAARQGPGSRDSSMTAFRWTMPTDGLLTSARRTLQTPALSASVLDAAAVPIPGTPFKGD
jgi:hypothetical protein